MTALNPAAQNPINVEPQIAHKKQHLSLTEDAEAVHAAHLGGGAVEQTLPESTFQAAVVTCRVWGSLRSLEGLQALHTV